MPPERAAQIAVIDWMRKVLPMGSIVAAIKNEEKPRSDDPHARARFVAARKRSGMVVGIPDIVAAMPGGRTFWLEMKAPRTGVISADQSNIHTDLQAIGHQVGIATCIDTARHALRAMGVPLRESALEPSRPAVVRVAKRKTMPVDGLPF